MSGIFDRINDLWAEKEKQRSEYPDGDTGQDSKTPEWVNSFPIAAAERRRRDERQRREALNRASIQARKQVIWNYLLSNFVGVTEIHAAAIMGNIQAESEYSHLRKEGDLKIDSPEYIPDYRIDDGVGWGLIQWTYWARKKGLLDYANAQGTNVGDLITQLEYFHRELYEDDEYKYKFKSFLKIADLKEATIYFQNEIERPYADSAHTERRIDEAYQAYIDFASKK